LLELPDSHLAGPIDTLTGSYAGAQGWGQFMPSSIRDYAVDEDGDGRIDLKNSLPDIFASVANYFAKHGWVRRPVAACARNPTRAKPITVKDSTPQWPLEQLEAWGYAPLQHLNPGPAQQPAEIAGRERSGVLVHLPEFLRDHALQPQPAVRDGGESAGARRSRRRESVRRCASR
jgi:membrane-bound lytic murein transglycosylase B